MPKPIKPRLGSIYRRKKRLPDGTVVELPVYWIKYHRNGQVFRESSKTDQCAGDRTDAERLLMQRIAEISTGNFQGPKLERITISELLDDVLLDYRMNAKAVRFASNAIDNHLRPYFKGRRASALSTADVRRYVEFRRSSEQGTCTMRSPTQREFRRPIRPASNATINRELALLKHGFYLGWRSTPRKVANIPHIPLLAENNVRKGFFEHDQFLAMRRALPEHLRPVLTFAYYTGCRRGEILALRWEQVDLTARTARLEAGTTKNGEARILPLTEELFQVLSMQRSIRDAKHPGCPWVFFSDAGEQIRYFRRSWETACKAAKLTDAAGEANRLFHDLRRSGVRNLIRAGVPEAVAMRISGHRTRSVFDRYNIVSERDLKEAARKLESYLGAMKQEKAAETPARNGHTLGTLTPIGTTDDSAKLLQ